MAYARYADIDDVREEAGLTGNTNITDAIITKYRDTAEDEADGKIAKRYTLPLSEVPDSLENAVIQLAAGLLLTKEYGPEAEGTTKDGQMKLKLAYAYLDGIADGSIELIGASGSALSESGRIAARGLPDDEDEDPPIVTIDEKF